MNVNVSASTPNGTPGVPGTPPQVPDHSGYDLHMACTMHTGRNAVEAVTRYLASPTTPRQVAIDIEAAGLGAAAFTVRCVTAAFVHEGGVHAVLLDPRRVEQAVAVRRLTDAADMLVLHNAPYDVPPMVHYGLMSLESVSKIFDTLVAARMAYTDPLVPKGLAALAARPDLLDFPESEATMKQAFAAFGAPTLAAGFATMDVDSPVYRLGAMADTVVTLRLAAPLVEAVVSWLTSNPYLDVDRAHALRLLEREQTTNRVMLAVSARGLKVDKDYLATYTTAHEEERATAAATLAAEGLDPEAGNLGAQVLDLLDSKGELPSDWPRTATGRLKADKKAMAALAEHPLVAAQQKVAQLSKISGYLEKIAAYAQVTGRCHPQVGVLGASATGRMSYKSPELQQLPDAARGILVPDNPGEGRGWVSVDLKSIEPVVAANCAGDREFLRGFNERGADLYAPIVQQAQVTRKQAKVVLLAALYGQGRRLLAANLGVDVDEAGALQQRVFGAMPRTYAFLTAVREAGERTGLTTTADGRLLPIPRDKEGKYQGYKATNYVIQGTSYSLLSEAINTAARAGLGQGIALAVHDELVVEAEAAEAIEEIMRTPPGWLNEFSGGTVVLRTDCHCLPERWMYV